MHKIKNRQTYYQIIDFIEKRGFGPFSYHFQRAFYFVSISTRCFFLLWHEVQSFRLDSEFTAKTHFSVCFSSFVVTQ